MYSKTNRLALFLSDKLARRGRKMRPALNEDFKHILYLLKVHFIYCFAVLMLAQRAQDFFVDKLHLLFSDNPFLVVCRCRLCIWGYFKYNLWLQTGALVRCRYLNSAGFLSQTSDFPHTFPLRGLEKKCRKSNKVSPEGNRVDKSEALHCLKSTLGPHTGWAGGAVKESRAWLCACGLQRPAHCQPQTCENHIVVCAAERAAAQAFAKSACLNFYFCFLPLASDTTRRAVPLHNLISGLLL